MKTSLKTALLDFFCLSSEAVVIKVYYSFIGGVDSPSISSGMVSYLQLVLRFGNFVDTCC